MAYSFTEWLDCPACEGTEDVKILAYDSDIVLECYDCGQISEFEVGNDVPFNNLSRNGVENAGADDSSE